MFFLNSVGAMAPPVPTPMKLSIASTYLSFNFWTPICWDVLSKAEDKCMTVFCAIFSFNFKSYLTSYQTQTLAFHKHVALVAKQTIVTYRSVKII